MMASNDPVVGGRSTAATLVLLPGLDGTDVFFQPLLASLPASITPLVVIANTFTARSRHQAHRNCPIRSLDRRDHYGAAAEQPRKED
jgi:hypothetical protein